ncbi:Protein of unknown function [Pyronema omphalodes CBS 100304]|uniref:Uncharacterized protein n=1 Tax=Pyronema omphalodes (strain CBS 100304) TaxID=1076935 RepID=U4L7T3_PYROM|nr:Protein of unknown function [Pyronema omphalodes CBS 100304]
MSQGNISCFMIKQATMTAWNRNQPTESNRNAEQTTQPLTEGVQPPEELSTPSRTGKSDSKRNPTKARESSDMNKSKRGSADTNSISNEHNKRPKTVQPPTEGVPPPEVLSTPGKSDSKIGPREKLSLPKPRESSNMNKPKRGYAEINSTLNEHNKRPKSVDTRLDKQNGAVNPELDTLQEKSLTENSSGDMNEISDLKCQIQQLAEQCSYFCKEASESTKKSQKLEDQLTFMKGCSKMLEREIEKYEMKTRRHQSENHGLKVQIERSAKTDEEEIQSLISENEELREELNLIRVKHIKVVEATGTGLEPIAGGVLSKRLDDLHNKIITWS